MAACIWSLWRSELWEVSLTQNLEPSLYSPVKILQISTILCTVTEYAPHYDSDCKVNTPGSGARPTSWASPGGYQRPYRWSLGRRYRWTSGTGANWRAGVIWPSGYGSLTMSTPWTQHRSVWGKWNRGSSGHWKTLYHLQKYQNYWAICYWKVNLSTIVKIPYKCFVWVKFWTSWDISKIQLPADRLWLQEVFKSI